MVLSGPSFASEVSRGKPTALCLAGQDAEAVKTIQALFMTPNFRVYADDDLIGVQLGGSLKNVMALAAGVVDGLELGHNARAALITRGLAEMIRLGVAMGADPRTFYGLSGVGDLILTCTGPLSRNHSVGVRLGKGERLEGILASMQAVAEGVRTAKAALGLAQRCGVDMPIVQEVNAVLFADKPCRQAVGDLMEREAKGEKSSVMNQDSATSVAHQGSARRHRSAGRASPVAHLAVREFRICLARSPSRASPGLPGSHFLRREDGTSGGGHRQDAPAEE